MNVLWKLNLLTVLSCLSFNCVSSEQVVYQWRDSNNVLHVSQLPPADVDYQTIVVGAKTSRASSNTSAQPSAKPSPENEQSCNTAMSNLKVLQQDLPVYIDLADGKRELLDESKRAEQTQLAEKQVKMFCKQPVP
jgi:hypothetical protein